MSTAAITPTPRRPRRIWRWVLGIFATGFLATVIVVYNLITLSSDASALRNELLGSLDFPSHLRVQGSVGPVLLSAVRTGASFFKDLPREAILALRSVRKLSVGVYELDHTPGASDRQRMFVAADKVMESRGWSRTVAVNDGDALVLVYFPIRAPSGSAERMCVAVCNERNLVVVSGNVRLEPLVEIATRHKALARF